MASDEKETRKMDWNAHLVRFFVDNSRLVWLILIAIVVGGIFSLTSLHREGFPAVSPKVVLVQTAFPGAAASEVESQVTRPIESAIKDVKNLKEFSSSSQNSFSNVTVTFDDSVNIDQAIQEVQSKAQSVQAELPKDAEQPKVSTFDTSGPAFVFGVTKDNSSVTDLHAAAINVSNELTTVSGVKSAKLLIDTPDRIEISFRPADLVAKNVSLTSLSQVLQAANVTFPLGALDVSGKSQTVVSVGAFSTLDDIRGVQIGVDKATHQPTLLKDVAEVKQGLGNDQSFNRFGFVTDGTVQSKPGVLVSVQITKDADVIKTKQAIDAHLSDLLSKGVIDTNLSIVNLSDQAKSTSDQVAEIVAGALGSKSNWYILGGLQLLFLAMLLFVNWRAALVAAISIPLSLGVTFSTLLILGVQFNTIVLFSLILVLGLIVDPAIVMVEAIQRYRDLHYDSRESIVESGRRYGTSIFMAVLTSFIVFVPFGVVSGIFGQIIKYIPITVVPALVASYFIPMAILPMLAGRLLRGRPGTKTKDDHEGLSKAAEFVIRLNTWILARPVRQILVLFLAFILVGAAGSIVAFGKIQIVQFSTPQDNQSLDISATFAKGLTFADRDKAAGEIEKLVMAQKAVKQFYYQDQTPDSFNLWIDLKDKSERTDASDKSKAVLARLQDPITKVSGIDQAIISEAAIGPPQATYQIQTQVFTNNPQDLEKAAKDIGSFLNKQDHVVKVNDGFSNSANPQIEIQLQRNKVDALGLSSAEIGTQLQSLVSEAKITKFNNQDTDTSEDVFLTNAAKPGNVDDIKNLALITHSGSTIHVGDVANVVQTSTVDAIQHFNGDRFVNVQARLDDQKNTVSVQQKLDSYLNPDKVKELNLSNRQNRGEFDDIAKSFRELGIALVIAIMLTYLVLVLQFKSFSQPFIMLFTIPLSLIGVFPALYLTKSDLGFLELLGVTILVGIVENVAIFLIDYANQLRQEKGLSAKEAIINASGVRFRPILLTKLVALGGLLPLAIESDFWRGLSVVIIAGIGVSGFLSLVVIPILYFWIESARTRLHRRA